MNKQVTNCEYFKEQIKELLDNGRNLAVVKGKPTSCADTHCVECDFYSEINNCSYKTTKWLVSEHLEEVTVKASELAIDTKVICWNDGKNEIVSTKYFATLFNGVMYAYANGGTSKEKCPLISWEHMTLVDGTVVLPE